MLEALVLFDVMRTGSEAGPYGRPGRGRAGRYATSLGQGFSMRQPRGAPDAAQDVIFHVQDNFGRGAAPFCPKWSPTWKVSSNIATGEISLYFN